MQLCGIPCRTTKGLESYSQLVTNTILSFNNTHSSTGRIDHDPSYGLPPDEDWLDYWDKWNTDITFGRYLLFTKNNAAKEVFPFWTGFSSTQDKTIYCIWFERKKPFTNCSINFSNFIVEQSCKELWFLMDNTDLNNFCTSCVNPGAGSQILKDFWHRVLGAL